MSKGLEGGRHGVSGVSWPDGLCWAGQASGRGGGQPSVSPPRVTLVLLSQKGVFQLSNEDYFIEPLDGVPARPGHAQPHASTAGAQVDHIITDKMVTISAEKEIKGTDSYPVYIVKGYRV